MIDFGSLTLTDLKQGTLVQARIIGALVLREMRTRFGERQLGYAWALIEPMVQIALLVAIFSALGRRPALGTSFEAFFLNGFVPYSLYTQISNRAALAISSNRSLVSFPPVRNMDTVWARIVLEVGTGAVSFVVLVLVFAYMNFPIVPNNIVDYFFGFLSIILLSSGIGVFNAAVSPIFGLWMTIYGWSVRLQYFFCGIFFLPDSLSPNVRMYIMLNPAAHCIIWIREGFYSGYHSAFLLKWYPLAVGVILLILGLGIERRFRRFVDAR